MDVNKIGSLAAAFVSDAKVKEVYKSQNPASKVIHNYIFSIDLIRDDARCAMHNDCEWFKVPEEEQNEEDLQKFILCITCDRIYHLRCTGADFSAIPETQLPWMCSNCLTNPMNADAQNLVIEKKHLILFDDRIKYFIKDTSLDEEEIESEDDALNNTIHLNNDLQQIPADIVAIIKNMQKKYQEMAKENKRLQKLIKKNQVDIEKFNQESKESMPASSKIINPSHTNTSYANAILDANTVSTRIDAAISNSQPFNNIVQFDKIKPTSHTAVDIGERSSSSSNSQNDATIKHLNALTLNEIRKSLPRIETFDGKPEKWLTFSRAVERNWREGQYSDDMMKLHIRQALSGQALTRVDSLIDLMTAEQVMQFLKESYGNSSIVVEQAKQKLLNVKLSKPLTHSSCVEVTTQIANYMAACTYAGLLIADSSLSYRIHNQLEPFHQQMYYEYYFKKFPTATTRVERLDIQFEFLNNISKTLPLGTFKNDENKANKSKLNYQVMSTAFNENSASSSYNKFTSNTNDAFKFEIRDKETAKYLGYDMVKLKEIPKRCEICGRSNHYTIECRSYRDMKMDTRFNTARNKGLCLNCMVTTSHTARDCEIKPGCGYKLDKTARCTAKHHITLHRGSGSNNFKANSSNLYKKQQRRAKTNRNAARANEKLKNFNDTLAASASSSKTAQVLQHQLPVNETPQRTVQQGYPAQPPATVSSVSSLNSHRPYQMCTISTQLYNVNYSSHRTVKLFKTYFYGSKGKAIGFSVGDSASEITLVKRQLIDDLGITGELCPLNLQWTDSIVKNSVAMKVKLRISGILPNSEILELDECYAIEDLELAARSLNVDDLKKKFPYLRNIPFDSYHNAIPSVLIGSRHAYMVEGTEPVIQGGNSKPVAIKTKLGFTIYGGAPEIFQSIYAVNTHQINECENENSQQISNQELNEIYSYSCSIDSLGIKNKEVHLTRDELQAMEIVEEEMRILPNGSVELPLIWNRKNKQIPILPNNYAMVYKRQIAQENKLKKSPELLEAYNKNFIELIKEGYVRAANERDIKTKWPNIWYLPMSLVVNSNKQPVKTRNVYDASARYQGTSLNDNLLLGPNLLVDMLQPLMRMRMYKFAFTGDVKSMFHRIMICERDQQCQRILWRQNLEDPIQIYIQQVMLFGPSSSPFGSQIVKNKTADKWLDKYPNAARALKEFTYMDDLLSSEPTAQQAIDIATQCIEILKSINWHLVGFQSNSLEVLQALSKENVKQEAIEIMTTDESTYTTKVLGVSWNPKIDAYIFNFNKNAFIKLVTECGHKPTKRDQCSTIARIFDVLGFISHCIIRGKILLQRSWRQHIDWDDEISDEDHTEWLKWSKNLEKCSLLRIPRLRFHNFNITDADKLELHTFCDAGKEAIAAVSYLVATINGYRYVSFIMSKAKVAPIKLKTKTAISEMPRLEMLSSLIAARLTNTIIKFHKEFDIDIFMWSDSEIVLNWLKNDNIKLPKFAISPIEEILELTESSHWHHVDSKNNVADRATKFQKYDFGDINSDWFQGPKFLKLSKEHWPEQKIKDKIETAFVGYINQEATLVDNTIILPSINCSIASDHFIDLFSAGITSRWSKLVRAVGRALKFYFNAIIPILKSKQWNNKETRETIKSANNFENLTPLEIERAELFIIRRMQREVYMKEYERLRLNKRINNTELLQLNVFMDNNGIIRINSRVDLPKSIYAQKFAPVVPRKSILSDALLFHYHYKFKHVGIESQVADFRSKYWMPQLRTALKRTQSLCNYCGFRRTQPVEYKMSALPNIRTNCNLKPFEVTGLDCAGPFVVYAKNGHQKKVWILIFTCTVTRFIHLHLLDTLSSLAVFEAIMVLWASHGPIKQFISDNGTNFVGTANIIQSDARKIIDFLKQTNRELESKLAEETYTSWVFIPVQSPWFGAFYERLIQTVKKSIASTIEGKKISRVEFNIALQEAAHRINCRPLTHNSISYEDEEVLTPHHLAKYRSGWPLLPSIHGMKEIPDPLGDKDQYRRGRIYAEEISRKFVSQYLPVLTKRTKWFKNFAPIKTGDLVLVIDPNKTRKAWDRARVHKLYLSKDKNARVADLLFPDGTIRKNRSVKRLAKLDIKSL